MACEKCLAQKAPVYKNLTKEVKCNMCGKETHTVLDLHHTKAVLCGLECERDYWIEMFYG